MNCSLLFQINKLVKDNADLLSKLPTQLIHSFESDYVYEYYPGKLKPYTSNVLGKGILLWEEMSEGIGGGQFSQTISSQIWVLDSWNILCTKTFDSELSFGELPIKSCFREVVTTDMGFFDFDIEDIEDALNDLLEGRQTD